MKTFHKILIRVERKDKFKICAEYTIYPDTPNFVVNQIKQEIQKDSLYQYNKEDKTAYMETDVVFYAFNDEHRYNTFSTQMRDSGAWKYMIDNLKKSM